VITIISPDKGKTMTLYAIRTPALAVALLITAGLAVTGCKGGGNAADSGHSAGTSAKAASHSGGSGGSGGSTSAGTDAYWPVGVGYTWVYDTDLGSSGHSTVTNKISRVVSVSGGQRVSMKILETDSRVPLTVTYVFHNDGSITVPATEFGSEGARLVSGRIVWPSAAQLASGQPYHSVLVFKIASSGLNAKVTGHVTVRGDGSQTVTVPAGTYHAQVVLETMREKFDGVAISTRQKTWIVNGIGPVKSELLGDRGALSTEQELKSFSK
jgi:hypothetical protein